MVHVIDTQLLNDVLATIGFAVALVVATSIWVVAAAALHRLPGFSLDVIGNAT